MEARAMRKMTAEIVLGEQTYTVHAFTLGELEQIVEMQADVNPRKFGFELIRMALKRADPPVNDVNQIEAGFEQIRNASMIIIDLAGLAQPETANPQKAAA
jgi:hypothetical protein